MDSKPQLPTNPKYMPLVLEFDQTTVDVLAVQNYLFAQPTYQQQGLQRGLGESTQQLLEKTDQLDYQMRLWLSWKTGWQELDEAIYQLVSFDKIFARPMAEAVLKDIQESFLRQEWYELLERLEYLRQHTEETLTYWLPATDETSH